MQFPPPVKQKKNGKGFDRGFVEGKIATLFTAHRGEIDQSTVTIFNPMRKFEFYYFEKDFYFGLKFYWLAVGVVKGDVN
jgi:hypothetical protein